MKKRKTETPEERVARQARSQRFQKLLQDRMRQIEQEFAARGQKLG